VAIIGIEVYDGSSTYGYGASGQTFLNYNFLNLSPQLGYRMVSMGVSLDLTVGLDMAYCLKTTEKGNATATNGTAYTTSQDRKTIKSEMRPRIQLAAGDHKTGVYFGYSHGFANYQSGSIGGINEAYARLIRFGLTYKLR
jgi:hypothetical protein